MRQQQRRRSPRASGRCRSTAGRARRRRSVGHAVGDAPDRAERREAVEPLEAGRGAAATTGVASGAGTSVPGPSAVPAAATTASGHLPRRAGAAAAASGAGPLAATAGASTGAGGVPAPELVTPPDPPEASAVDVTRISSGGLPAHLSVCSVRSPPAPGRHPWPPVSTRSGRATFADDLGAVVAVPALVVGAVARALVVVAARGREGRSTRPVAVLPAEALALVRGHRRLPLPLPRARRTPRPRRPSRRARRGPALPGLRRCAGVPRVSPAWGFRKRSGGRCCRGRPTPQSGFSLSDSVRLPRVKPVTLGRRIFKESVRPN